MYHYIIYICCLVVSYLFLLWYDYSLWHCFLLLSEEIQFPFSVTSMLSFVSHLKCPILSFFFPFLFSGYFHTVDPCVVSIVSGGYNQSSSTLFYVVFKLLYWCINTVFNAGKSSSSFFSWHFKSVNVISGVWCMVISLFVFWFICLSSSLVHFKNGPSYLTRRAAQIFIPLIRFLLYRFS